MLHHRGIYEPAEVQDDNNKDGILDHRLNALVKKGIAYALLATGGVVAFSVTSFVSVPFFVTVLANAWFSAGVIYLGGLSYGIVNDLIACRKNLPYFLLGHQYGQHSVIKSNKPNAVAVAWGVLAT